VILDATGVGKAAVELFRPSRTSTCHVFTLMAGDQMVQDGSSYRIPKRDVISTTQVLLQTGRLEDRPIATACVAYWPGNWSISASK
jgi:hypothetical protein